MIDNIICFILGVSHSTRVIPHGLLHVATQERVAELYEDLQEFKKAEHRYRESEHKSLEWEALKQYERTENEIELLLNPPKPNTRNRHDDRVESCRNTNYFLVRRPSDRRRGTRELVTRRVHLLRAAWKQQNALTLIQ